jgi:glyoxylase-like metal-dependent hydrolase (beta-lactamase superfamily II)
MELVAPNLHVLRSRPKYAFNSYLVDDVLVDAGTRHAERRILRELEGATVTAHAVSHAHADHQGSSHAICERLGLPLWAPAVEADAVESGDLSSTGTDNAITRWQRKHWAGPAHPVARRLSEGDAVGSFSVLQTPGHSPGLVSLWRESDRVLLAFDVLFGRHPITGRPELREPPAVFTLDIARNRESIRRLADLEPAIVCFGHGPPLRDAAPRLRALASSL